MTISIVCNSPSYFPSFNSPKFYPGSLPGFFYCSYNQPSYANTLNNAQPLGFSLSTAIPTRFALFHNIGIQRSAERFSFRLYGEVPYPKRLRIARFKCFAFVLSRYKAALREVLHNIFYTYFVTLAPKIFSISGNT